MTTRRMLRVAAAAALMLVLGSAAEAAALATTELREVSWRQLTFKARKLLMSATTTVSVDMEDRRTAETVLRPPPGTPAPSLPPTLARITMTSELPLGRSEVATAWTDPASGASLQAEKLVSGSRQYWKLRRYTPRGLFAWRAEPSSKTEAGTPHTAWSNREDTFEAWPQRIPPGVVVSDSYALLYLLSAARLDREGQQLRVLVFSDNRLLEVVFTSGATSLLQTSYRESWRGGSRERLGPVPVRTVTTQARALDGGAGDAPVNLDFMGITGELAVAVELGTGTPVQLEGRTDVVGRIRVKLQEAVLASSPATAQRTR